RSKRWDVMLHAGSMPADDRQQLLHVGCQVNLGHVDDEQWALGPVKEEPVIRLRDLLHVIQRHEPFLGQGTLSNAAQQDLGPRLQINHQVGTRNTRREQPVDFLIQNKLVVRQGQTSVDAVADEQVVGHQAAVRKQVGLAQLGLLLVPGEQEKELCLQCV